MESSRTRKQPQEQLEPRLRTLDIVWKEFRWDENNIDGHSDQFKYLFIYSFTY